MSLAQHVTAQEGIDNAPDTASLQLSRQLHRTISYDLIAPSDSRGPPQKLDAVGADQVSRNKRIAQVATGVISCALASGITFGYAALKMVLVEKGLYRDLCKEEELQRGVRVCYLQDQRLNLTFVVASITTNVAAMLVGTLLDRYGPRMCGVVGSIFLFFGAILMAYLDQLPFDAYIVGYFLLSVGGAFVFVPTFHLANAFPKVQGLIMALVTGAFDASAAVFLIFRLIHDATRSAFGLREFFLVYLVVPILFLLCQLTFMPVHSYETRAELGERMDQAKDPAQDIHDSDDELSDDARRRIRIERQEDREQTIDEITDILGTTEERIEYSDKEEGKRTASGVWGALHGQSTWKQMRTPWFILIALLTIITMARMNFLISTIWSQYRYMLGSAAKADRINAFFDIALPIGGIVTVPFIGLLLDHLSTATVLSILLGISTTMGVFGVIPAMWAGYCNVILFVLWRPLYYSAMSDYTAKVFGFATFGRIYGTLIAVSGLCTFAQPGLQALVHNAFHDSPTPVNLMLAGLGLIVGFALVVFVAYRSRVMREEKYAPGETDPLLPRNHKSSRPVDRMSTLAETQNDI